MKRKLLYCIIFISIFLMSSASMVSPVQGYEVPDIPKEAKNMILDDTEVTVYDEDLMEDCLGRGFDIKDIKNGDADIVGARSQMKITDWEADEDLVDYESVWVYEAVGFEANADTIRITLTELANSTTFLDDADLPPMLELIYLMTAGTLGADPITTSAFTADALAGAGIPTWITLMQNPNYAESYDGLILEREVWDMLDPAEEFDNSDPDTDDDEVPYMLDPRDWKESYDHVRNLGNMIMQTCDGISTNLNNWINGLILDAMGAGTKLAQVNGTMNALYPAELKGLLNTISYENYPVSSYIFAYYVVNSIYYNILYSVPEKFGYLLQLLESGQPVCTPGEDYIKKAVAEFGIEEDTLFRIPFISYGEDYLGLMGKPGADLSISPIPVGLSLAPTVNPAIIIPMGGETIYVYAEVEVSVDDAGTVTVEFNYQDGQLDPRDVLEEIILWTGEEPAELKDWEWVFPKASDAPTQMKRGDDIFYETRPMEGPIPGYEISVILGVSLVSVIGLIYVIMRKRKR